MFQKKGSRELELEAADYFKLDIDQLHQFDSFATIKPKTRNINESKMNVYNNHSPIKSNQDHKLFGGKNSSISTLRVAKKSAILNSEMKNSNSKLIRATGTSIHLSPINGKRKKELYKSNLNETTKILGSSSASTNSLPSLSSSPSISPSLVCPHLSLEDILDGRNDTKSPHTIGLCVDCRLDPPPNIHSPLSPAFKPTLSQFDGIPFSNNKSKRKVLIPAIKRGYSDHQVSVKSSKTSITRKSLKFCSQDESLDYYLEQSELKHSQLSPNLRHSVEFIRNNITEAGRVIRIYKNGSPFERPLRICIMIGEFASLTHLLDHINSRQIVNCGARYLFHIDGQLVYSVNELKHGSIYIVSGTRNFDFRANKILKDQLRQLSKPVRISPVDSVLYQSNNDQGLKSETYSTNKILRQKKENNELMKSNKCQIVTNSSKTNGKQNNEESKLYKAEVRQKPTISERKLNIRKTKQNLHSKQNKVHNIEFETNSKTKTFSNEHLASLTPTNEEKISKVVRAKSELSTLPFKRKKNVTFVDTGRGSSPAINIDSNQSKKVELTKNTSQKPRHKEPTEVERLKNITIVNPEELKEELNTNEIGIQVSDSLEGYLVDLPIPFTNEPQIDDRKRSYLKKGQGTRSGQKPRIIGKQVQKVEKTRKEAILKVKRPVLGIREKQLSLDEMGNIEDLNHGDHHEVRQTKKSEKEKMIEKVDETESKLLNNNHTTSVMNSKSEEIGIAVHNNPMIGSSSTYSNDAETHWNSPKGRISSVTPTERPISQCEANESVCARVTTPTPSLSTANDSTSLIISYDAPTGWASPIDEQTTMEKKRVPVLGILKDGLNPPSRNFKLIWINGFSINDQQADIIGRNLLSVGQQAIEKKEQKSYDQHLTASAIGISSVRSKFRPSERFENWICLSKKYNELIYPAGNLVVLWCRSNNEQRYYSQHTGNVSAISLASSDPDLSASAQDGNQEENINSSVHLWSLDTLETLSIIEDDHFKSFKIFTLRVKNTSSEGCKLSVCAKDNKRIWLHIFLLSLSRTNNTSTPQTEPDIPKIVIPKGFGQPVYSLQASKLLQNQQIPLKIIPMLNDMNKEKANLNPQSNSFNMVEDVILSFGIHHLVIWFLDRKRRQLIRLEPADKNIKLSNLIAHANCIECISSSELLLGDTNGNITMLAIDFISPSLNHKSVNEKKSTSTLRYNIKSILLVNNLHAKQEGEMLDSITCLTRISHNLFVAADSSCKLHFWFIERKSKEKEIKYVCKELSCLRLPQDFGFISTIIIAKHTQNPWTVEFYAASTSNAILHGSSQFSTTDLNPDENSSYITIVYGGHETSVVGLAADSLLETKQRVISKSSQSPKLEISSPTFSHSDYFTCSLDSKICKWSGKNLVWKSMLPSSCASLAVHPTGFVLAVGSADGTVYIIDKISGLLISYFPLTPVCINCLAYSKDGSLLAAGCANGSMFILPVYDRGLKYKKVSIFQSPHPVVSLQFSLDDRYILTSVTHDSYQELILWDLPNFRYMRDNVKSIINKIDWYDSICSGSEDVRAIWENTNLTSLASNSKSKHTGTKLSSSFKHLPNNQNSVINLSCHRLVFSNPNLDSAHTATTTTSYEENLTIASDTRGYLRLFRYPCNDVQQGFYEIRASSFPVNCCKFLYSKEKKNNDVMFVSTSVDGHIFLWTLI